MSTLLKDRYNPEFYNAFSEVATACIPTFSNAEFQALIFDKDWKNKELKDRMAHTAHCLHAFLDKDFKKAAQQLAELSEAILKSPLQDKGFECMFIPAYIEQYGLDDFEASIKAMTEITKLSSCEFAVRPFYLQYPDRMLAQTKRWSKHKDFRVRRLSSEGCRPRLPWAMALPFLKKNPEPILDILDRLRDDEAEFVRKSVANNLNDISKDHPEIALKLAKDWFGKSKHTDWVVKHGLRTLLKAGNPYALSFFGYGDINKLKLEDFQVLNDTITIGEYLEFQFTLQSTDAKAMMVRLEYAIYYLRANGTHSKKVFKISEKEIEGKSSIPVNRKQSFKPITTRTFYEGEHKVSVILNGKEFELLSFKLKK